MKICVMTTVHMSDDTRVYYKQVKSLVGHGYRVVYITLIGEKKNEDTEVEIIPIKSINKRFLRIVTSPLQALSKALKVNADVYHFHDPELMFVGLFLKQIKNKKVIYDVHEDVPRQILSKDWIPLMLRKPLSWTVELLENHIAKRFDYIITSTPHIRDRFLKINNNSIDVNNYPILSELYAPISNWDEKERVVCYVGEISKVRGIEEMVKAIGKTDYSLLLAGKYVSLSLRESCLGLNGWNSVAELGQISREGVKKVLERSNVGIVLFHPEPNHINAQPNKMFEYMSAGIPVIASNFDLWKEIIEKNNCGICVDPLNVDEIAEAINWIMDNPDKAKKMGENGRRAVEEKYNWEKESKKLIKIYVELLS